MTEAIKQEFLRDAMKIKDEFQPEGWMKFRLAQLRIRALLAATWGLVVSSGGLTKAEYDEVAAATEYRK